MEEDDKELEDTLSPVTDPIVRGTFYSEAIVWYCFVARYADRIVEQLAAAEVGARTFVGWRDQGKAMGLMSVGENELKVLRRLNELLAHWRATGEFSAEIEPLARLAHRALADRPESDKDLPPVIDD